MSNIVKTESFSLTPKTLEEAMKYAEMLAKSSIVPKGYHGKPGDILVAVQMGQELGLKPIQALQNIAVVNGKPSMYGDSCLALVKAHRAFEDIKEYYDDATETAHCEIKRKGQSWHKTSFSKIDAQKAGLWGKQGPWSQYTKRMQQMRARGFGIRDVFPDALQGLIFAEEAEDYPMENITPAPANNNAPTISKADELFTQITNNPIIDSTASISSQAKPVEQPESIYVHTAKTPAERLSQLIIEREVPDSVIDKWLNKAAVANISEMGKEELLKCIDLVEGKYPPKML